MRSTTRRGGAHVKRDADSVSDNSVNDRSVRDDRAQPVVGTRDRFGGLDLPAAFAGTMAALGMLALLGAVASAWSSSYGQDLSRDEVISTSGAAIALAIIVVSGLFGGWVTGRASRYTGTGNGLLTGLLLIAAAAGIGYLLGSQAEGNGNFRMPSWVTDDASSNEALIAAGIAAAVALVSAALGGALGTFWHRRVDRSLVAETVQDTHDEAYSPYPEEDRLVTPPAVDDRQLDDTDDDNDNDHDTDHDHDTDDSSRTTSRIGRKRTTR